MKQTAGFTTQQFRFKTQHAENLLGTRSPLPSTHFIFKVERAKKIFPRLFNNLKKKVKINSRNRKVAHIFAAD
jgi:hypothetical protein